MDSRLLGAIALIAVAGIAGVALLGSHGSPGQGAGTTQTTQSTGEAGGTATHGGSGASLEGTWRGTYRGSHGSGEWSWVIKRSGSTYVGCLKTTGTYSSHESWMPVSVELDGDSIKIGNVAMAVVFTGKVSGSRASGEWRFTNGADSGTWKGSRISDSTDLPCMNGGDGGHGWETGHDTNAGTNTGTGTQTGQAPPTATNTSTPQASGLPACSMSPPRGLSNAFNDVSAKLAPILGDSRVTCFTSSSTPQSYMAIYRVSGPASTATISSYYQQARQVLTHDGGWVLIEQSTYLDEDTGEAIITLANTSHTIIVGIDFALRSDGTVMLTVALQK